MEAHEEQHIEGSVGMGCKEGQRYDHQRIPEVCGIYIPKAPQVEPVGQNDTNDTLLKECGKEAGHIKVKLADFHILGIAD